jgi:hypothetical protein
MGCLLSDGILLACCSIDLPMHASCMKLMAWPAIALISQWKRLAEFLGVTMICWRTAALLPFIYRYKPELLATFNLASGA